MRGLKNAKTKKSRAFKKIIKFQSRKKNRRSFNYNNNQK